MAWMEAYKWPESNKSVENTDFSGLKNNPEKKIKKINFKSIENQEALSKQIETKLEKSSIKNLDERWKIADYILTKTKNNSEINNIIDVLIDSEIEIFEVWKEIIDSSIEVEEIIDKEEEVIDKKEEVIDKKEEVIDKKEEVIDKKENIEVSNNNLKKLLKATSNLPEWKKYSSTINKLGNLLNNWDYTNEELKDILNELKNPKTFVSIAKDLVKEGKYGEFKASLIWIDEDFTSYFEDFERIEWGESFNAESVIKWVEKNSWGIVDIDLGNNPPSSKLSLIGTDYWFNDDINKKEFDEITKSSSVDLWEIKKFGFDVLKDFYKNFNSNSFDLWGMTVLYSHFDVKSDDEININDLEDFRNAETEEEKQKIFKEKIRPKFDKLIKIVGEKQALVLEIHKEEIKDLVIREKIRKKEQLETLKFLHSIGFDIFSNSDIDGIIDQINLNKGMFGIKENINLKNWNLGSVYGSDNLEEKKNFAEIMNILFSGKKEWPIKVDSVWASLSNPTFMIGWEVKDYGQFMTTIKWEIWANKKMFLQENLNNFLENK